jgi:hypothetical protein
MRALTLIALAVALSVNSEQAGAAPWMTGERLLELLTYRPGVKGNFDLTPKEYLDAERARLYIEGVHDNSEGKSWCYGTRYQAGPDAMREAVEMALPKLSREQLKRNAADLIIEIWGKRWPCAARKEVR